MIRNLGRVCPIFCGEYDNEHQYSKLDVVLYEGSSWVALCNTICHAPSSDSEYWQLVAVAGELNSEQITSIEEEVLEYIQEQDYVIDSQYVHTDNNYTSADKAKVSNVDGKQDVLVSGQNIKTVNNQSLIGSGNITIQGGSAGTTDYNALTNTPSINGVTLTGNKTTAQLGINIPDVSTKQNTLISGQNIKTVNNQSLIGSGNITIQGGTTNYNMLSNKPQIGDANIQIFQGGVLKGSFNLNDREDVEGSVTINLDAGGSGGGTSGVTDPTETTLSGSTINIPTLSYNSVYVCTSNVTSLTIGAFGTEHKNVETNIYLTTGDTITMSLPSTTKYAPMRPVLQANTEYIITFKRGVCVVCRIS